MSIKKIVLLICIILLSGCWDQNEAERMLYAHAVGVDYKDDEYIIYLQIINFANVAKSESPSPEVDQSEVGVSKGKTMEEAIDNLYRETDERVFWGHLAYLVFSEDSLKNKGINAVIDSFIRYIETRYRIWVYSTKDDVKSVLLSIPIINKSLTISKLDDPMNSYQQNSMIYPLNIRELIIGLNEPNHEITIPLVKVDQNWETVKEKKKTVSIEGVSIVDREKYKGRLEGKKAYGLQWMNKKSKEGEVSFHTDENGPEFNASVIIRNVRTKITPIVKGENITFDIKITVDALGNIMPPNTTEKDLNKKVKETIANEVKQTFKEALDHDVDIYRLSEQVYRKENKTWEKIQKNGKITLTEDSIAHLEVKIRNFKSGRKSLINTFIDSERK